MAIKELLRLVVEADVDGAVRSVNTLGKTADRELSKAESKIDKTGAQFRKTGAVMLGAGALAAAGLFKTVGAASDLNEAANVTGLVFGDAADEIGEFSKGAAKGLGLSETAAREATAQFGGLLKNLSFGQEETLKWSKDLTTLAADMGSAFNTSTEDAIAAIGAGLRGESEPLKRFNVFLSETELKTKAVEMGLAASTSEVDRNGKAQAALAAIMEQTSDVQGDFANTSDQAANAAKVADAQFENAKASLGEALLPVMAEGAGIASALAGGFVELNDSTGGLLSTVALGGTAFLLIGGAMSTTIGYAIKARESFVALKAAMVAPGFAASAATFGAVGVAVVAASVAVNKFKGEMSDAADRGSGLADQLMEGFDASTATVDEFVDQMNRLTNAHNEMVERANNAVNPFKKEQYLEAADAIAVQRREMGSTYDAAFQLKEELGITGQAALDMARNEDVASAATDELTGEIDANAAALEAEQQQIEETIAAWDDLADALSAQFDPLFAAQDATLKLGEAQAKAAWTAAEFGASSDEAAAANRDVAKAALDNEQAQIELRSAIESGDVALDSAKATLRRWVAEGAITEEQARQMGEEFGVAAWKANSIPTSRTTDFHANTDNAFVQIDRLARRINDIYRQTSVGLHLSVGGGGGLSLDTGGPIPGPRGAPVPMTGHGGEFMLSANVVDAIKRGKSTANLDASGSFMAGGAPARTAGGGMTVVKVDVDGRELFEFMLDAEAEHKRRNGRG